MPSLHQWERSWPAHPPSTLPFLIDYILTPYSVHPSFDLYSPSYAPPFKLCLSSIHKTNICRLLIRHPSHTLHVNDACTTDLEWSYHNLFLEEDYDAYVLHVQMEPCHLPVTAASPGLNGCSFLLIPVKPGHGARPALVAACLSAARRLAFCALHHHYLASFFHDCPQLLPPSPADISLNLFDGWDYYGSPNNVAFTGPSGGWRMSTTEGIPSNGWTTRRNKLVIQGLGIYDGETDILESVGNVESDGPCVLSLYQELLGFINGSAVPMLHVHENKVNGFDEDLIASGSVSDQLDITGMTKVSEGRAAFLARTTTQANRPAHAEPRGVQGLGTVSALFLACSCMSKDRKFKFQQGRLFFSAGRLNAVMGVVHR
ncbi:hypothetical protein V8D89_013834 [Ganoderma adspersum]